MTMSTSSSFARWIASKMTEPGSARSLPLTTSQPTRRPHTSSWVTAAARNVSPAANKSVLPCLSKRLDSFPIVVVFPTPFTPTTRMTVGVRGVESPPPLSAKMMRDSARMASHASSAELSSPLLILARKASRIRWVVCTPTSAVIRTSSTSSRMAGSNARSFRKTPANREIRLPRVDLRPARNAPRSAGGAGGGTTVGSGISVGGCSGASTGSWGAPVTKSSSRIGLRGLGVGSRRLGDLYLRSLLGKRLRWRGRRRRRKLTLRAAAHQSDDHADHDESGEGDDRAQHRWVVQIQ